MGCEGYIDIILFFKLQTIIKFNTVLTLHTYIKIYTKLISAIEKIIPKQGALLSSLDLNDYSYRVDLVIPMILADVCHMRSLDFKVLANI